MPTLQTTLDTSDRIVTPENIAFEYRLAGPFRRYGAWLIDLLIQGLVLIVVSLLASLFAVFDSGVIGLPLVLLSIFFLLWFYGGFFETWWNGQTPEKGRLDCASLGFKVNRSMLGKRSYATCCGMPICCPGCRWGIFLRYSWARIPKAPRACPFRWASWD